MDTTSGLPKDSKTHNRERSVKLMPTILERSLVGAADGGWRQVARCAIRQRAHPSDSCEAVKVLYSSSRAQHFEGLSHHLPELKILRHKCNELFLRPGETA